MSLPLFLQGIGSIGIFASRAFLPAFVTALLLRFGPHAPWLAKAGLLPHVRDVPTWFTSDVSLVVLGILSVLELVAERIEEVHIVLDEVHDYLKTGMAVLTYLGVLNATDQAAVQPMIQQGSAGDYVPMLLIGAGVFIASQSRRWILGPLAEIDEDDHLGLQRLIRWLEDLWGTLGAAVLVVLPILTLAAFGVAVVVLVLIERRIEARREREHVPCESCGHPIHSSALECPSCGTAVKGPRDVGLLGLPINRPARLATHPYRLAAVKRCPVCATRFKQRAVRQTCPACGHALMDDPKFAADYIAYVDRRVPMACLVGFVLGLVPVVGIIPGVIYYRLAIVAPYRAYIPRGQGFLVRFGLRLAIVLLVALQWIPIAGALSVPAMALLNYAAYRTAYRKQALVR